MSPLNLISCLCFSSQHYEQLISSFQKTSLARLEGYYLIVPVFSRFDYLGSCNLSSLVLSYNVLVVFVVLLFLFHLLRKSFFCNLGSGLYDL